MTQLEEYQIREIEDTLRLVSNMIDAPKRDTCLKRMVMKCWHWCSDALNNVPQSTTSENFVKYYMRPGLIPTGQETSQKQQHYSDPNADDDGEFFCL